MLSSKRQIGLETNVKEIVKRGRRRRRRKQIVKYERKKKSKSSKMFQKVFSSFRLKNVLTKYGANFYDKAFECLQIIFFNQNNGTKYILNDFHSFLYFSVQKYWFLINFLAVVQLVSTSYYN
jgi:hypothetical protein